MEITALIMAGGRGERFWPRSRRRLPKQFLSLTGDGKTMLQLTVERILPLVPAEHIFIATGRDYRSLVLEQLPDIPEGNILCEPVGRNTAPCIGLGAVHIEKRFGEALMLVLASDHMIRFEDRFLETLREACSVAEEGENLVTVGIRPGYPETGYGYIRLARAPEEGQNPAGEDAGAGTYGDEDGPGSVRQEQAAGTDAAGRTAGCGTVGSCTAGNGIPGGISGEREKPLCAAPGTAGGLCGHSRRPLPSGKAYPVECFVEKPDRELAERYVESGDYLWNSGMFVWKVSSVLKNIERFLPEMYHGLKVIEEAIGTDREQETSDREFPGFPPVSIDYGVMEKAEHICTVPGDFGWDDVGSWLAVGRLGEADEAGNVTGGNVLAVDTENCILQGGEKLIATVGVRDLVVVDTEDATLICSRDGTNQIKMVLEELRQRKRENYL